MPDTSHFKKLPIAPLGIVAMKSFEDRAKEVDDYIVEWRKERWEGQENNLPYDVELKDSYLLNASTPRFGSGEAKGVLLHSVRGEDVYILVDVCNYSLTYRVSGITNFMSPDDHFQDIKRIISAIGGKARRINVIMPFLYEGRQHKRAGRESLDCSMMLQELARMGVENIITFDAHDARIQNSIPSVGFENVPCIYQFIKALIKARPDLKIDSDHMMVISPDEGGTSRAVVYSNYLGLDMGMFYKRRDYSVIIDGKNPIVSHEFLGSNVEGKDVLIIDDMISSGDSMLDVAKELKMRKARRVFCISTFGLFTNGFEKFDKAYEEKVFDLLLTTNLIYQPQELLERPYYQSVNLMKYVALIIDHLNHNASLHELLNPTDRINRVLEAHRAKS